MFLLAIPCSVALLVFARPLVATLFHYGAFKDRDVAQVALAFAGYGSGLLGPVAIKVLAPGYYASQDMKTPMRIAIAALVATQLFNLALVPVLRHAGLALSIGLGALLNALLLLIGLLRRGSYKPLPGWGVFVLQVIAGSALLAIFLMWGAASFPWLGMRGELLKRVGLMTMMLLGAAAIYFIALAAAGVRLRQFVTH